MVHPWDADEPVSAARAAELIAARFGRLRPVHVEPIGEGWDNAAFLVNGHVVFRFPRRAASGGFLEREARALAELAPHLPVAVPNLTWMGRSTGTYPYVFAGYEVLPGTTACRAALDDTERDRLAEPLARFLAALHNAPVPEPAADWPPVDEIRRTDLPYRCGVLEDRLRRIGPSLPGLATDDVIALARRLAKTPPHGGRPRWVHGDLYARHVLVGGARELAGVIDWGDVHVGDPALDLAIAFTMLPADARGRFREAYGGVDESTWSRARFRAICHSAVLVEYGADVRDAELKASGVYGLRGACSGPWPREM